MAAEKRALVGQVPLDDLADDIETLRLAQAEQAKWKSVEDAVKEKVQARLGNNEAGTVGGKTVVEWPWRYPERVDVKKLRADMGDDTLRAAGYLKKSETGERRFELKD